MLKIVVHTSKKAKKTPKMYLNIPSTVNLFRQVTLAQYSAFFFASYI